MFISNDVRLRSADCEIGSGHLPAITTEDPPDPELEALFRQLTVTLRDLMEPEDADILTQADLADQTPSDIAARTGCTEAEAVARIARARACFCNLVVLTLSPTKWT